MAYEYESDIPKFLKGIEYEHPLDLSKEIKEIQEVYRKAKAFDEIKKLEKETILYSIAGKEDVELGAEARKIINKYMEDK